MSVLFTRRGAPPVTYDPVFANNTWEQIIEACQANEVPETWNIADQKAMDIGGTEYLIDIIGKNHDEYSDGTGTAPLTFQMHDCYGTTYYMHPGNTSSKGWTNCEMRKTTLPTLFALMPSEVQNGICEVNKQSSKGSNSSTIETTADTLFLLAEIEIFNTTDQSYSGEGTQYEYYANGGSVIKYLNGTATAWWQRSPRKGFTTGYGRTQPTGDNSGEQSSTYHGVAFAFCF